MTEEQIKQNAEAYSNGIDGSILKNTAYDAYIAGAHSILDKLKELESKSVSVCGDRFDLKKQLDELTEKYENVLYHAKRMAEEYNDEYNRYYNSTYDLEYFDYSGIACAVEEFEEYCKQNNIKL